MTGVLIGLLLGGGLYLIVTRGRPRAAKSGPSWTDRRQEKLLQAGIEGVSPGQLVALQVALFVLVFVLMLVISGTATVSVFFAGFAAYAPEALVKRQRLKRTADLREVWPEVVDNLASAVRAGLSLPEALSSLATRGPEVLRPAFTRFASDYRATGRFSECLDRLKNTLADPVADRIAESLRMAREVGGTDLGTLLRTLSAFLREDARARSELETRQSWTVNAARLAVGAPWLVLLLLATQSATVAAYDTAAGFVILVVGAVITFAAYRLMLRIGRLPTEQRVLR